MNLRQTFLLVICIIPITLMGSIYIYRQYVTLPHYQRLENDIISIEVQRIENILQENINDLDLLNWDWASWDDTYNYMETRNPEYIESNLVNSTFTDTKLSMVILQENNTDLVYGRYMNIETEEDLEIPQEILNIESSNSSGIIKAGDDFFIFSSKYILTSNDEGPARGRLIMTRIISENYIDTISKLLTINLNLEKSENINEYYIKNLNTTHHQVIIPIKNNEGDNIFNLSYIFERTIYMSEIANTNVQLQFIFGFAIISGIFSFILADNLFLKRLKTLTETANSIIKEKNFKGRLPDQGDNELSILVNNFNGLLDAYSNSQKELFIARESQYTELISGLKKFSATVRHDIRNSLKNIGNALFLIDQDKSDTEEMLEIIKRNVDHIKEILADWRYNETIGELNITLVDLNEICTDVLESVYIPKNIQVITKLKFIALEVDRVKIKRVIYNLVKNAIEAMPDGGKLLLEMTSKKDHVLLAITDTGVGISETIIGNLFKPFFTMKPIGSGLGLFYCKLAIESHGGEIQVQSKENQGTTFTLKIPLKPSK